MADLSIKLTVPGLEKLVDYTASGIGAVAGPMLAPWQSRQQAKVKLIESSADADSLRTIAKAQAEARQALIAPDDSVRGTLIINRDQITQRLEFQEEKRQRNIVSAVAMAAAELSDKEVNDHEPDHDWTARFFEGVQDVSSDDIRKIWARILAREVEAPGGVSLRTLSILKNMSSQEAIRFSEIMRYRLNDFILDDYCLKSAKSVTSHDLTFRFEDMGLFYSPTGVRPDRHIALNSTGAKVLVNCENVLVLEGRRNTSVDVESKVILKAPAMELAPLCGARSDPTYLRYFAKHLSKKGCTLKVGSIVDITPDGDFRYSPAQLRVIEPTL